MKATRRIVIATLIVLAASACGDDSGDGESYQCGDGTKVEVLRSDQPDDDGNIARVRFVDAEGERIGSGERVSEAGLVEVIAACESE